VWDTNLIVRKGLNDGVGILAGWWEVYGGSRGLLSTVRSIISVCVGRGTSKSSFTMADNPLILRYHALSSLEE